MPEHLGKLLDHYVHFDQLRRDALEVARDDFRF